MVKNVKEGCIAVPLAIWEEVTKVKKKQLNKRLDKKTVGPGAAKS